jgi:prepilin-type processing-associated H-X9-DG protein
MDQMVTSVYGGATFRAMTDYAGNAGTESAAAATPPWGQSGNGLDAPIARRHDGSSSRGSQVTMAAITDGSSNTLLLGEKCFNSAFVGSSQTDDDLGWANDGWDWDTVRWGNVQPSPDWSDPKATGMYDGHESQHLAFGSAHPGMFNAALCDGSVRALSFNIALDPTFKALCSRNDGTVLDAKAF